LTLGHGEFDLVHGNLAVKVRGEVDLQQGYYRWTGGYGVGPCESHASMRGWINLLRYPRLALEDWERVLGLSHWCNTRDSHSRQLRLDATQERISGK
jgi:hypothetical protein